MRRHISPQKYLPLLMEIRTSIEYMVPPQTASRSVQPFLHRSSVCPAHTDTQTHGPRYVWHL